MKMLNLNKLDNIYDIIILEIIEGSAETDVVALKIMTPMGQVGYIPPEDLAVWIDEEIMASESFSPTKDWKNGGELNV